VRNLRCLPGALHNCWRETLPHQIPRTGPTFATLPSFQGGPKVRIHFPPAASQERTSHRVTRRIVTLGNPKASLSYRGDAVRTARILSLMSGDNLARRGWRPADCSTGSFSRNYCRPITSVAIIHAWRVADAGVPTTPQRCGKPRPGSRNSGGRWRAGSRRSSPGAQPAVAASAPAAAPAAAQGSARRQSAAR
jgi:hypothetical protein